MAQTSDGNKIKTITLLTLSVFLMAFLAVETAKTNKEIRYVGVSDKGERQITIEGSGKVTAIPDIATITIGIDSKGENVTEVQSQNSEQHNALVDSLKKLGIDEKDMKTTSYNVYENQKYNPATSVYESNGWVVSQRLELKIRNLENLAKAIEVAGQGGANSISGPSFTIDDLTNIKDEARDKAIADSNKKAEIIADQLDVKLGKIIGYSEWMDGGYPPVMYETFKSGAREDAAYAGAPSIEAGQNEYTLNVNVVYELR